MLTKLQREDLLQRLELHKAQHVDRISVDLQELEELLHEPEDLLEAATRVRDAAKRGTMKVEWNAAVGHLRAVLGRYRA